MRWWDIEPVLGLERVLFPEDAWSAGLFWSELAHARGPQATRRYLVAETRGPDGTGLVAYGGLAAVGGTGDIQTIGVLPAHRGTGLGARLLARTARGGRAASTAARCCWRSGWTTPPHSVSTSASASPPSAVRRGYYQPGDVDALVMRLELPTPATTTPSQGTGTHG